MFIPIVQAIIFPLLILFSLTSLSAMPHSGTTDKSQTLNLRQINQLVDIDGQRLSHQKNQWIVINYWSDWCPPCIKEFPELNKLNEKYHEKVLLLGVHFDPLPKKELQALKEKFHLSYALLASDPSKRLRIPSPFVLPATYVFTPEGILKEKLKGPQTLVHFENLMNLKPPYLK